MQHGISLITTIAVGLGLALILGFVAVRLKLPALVGYLVAGIVVGPSTPGFVADVALASQLAEIGIMLLMFGVGLHFSVDDLMAVRRIALPGAIVQIAVATAMGRPHRRCRRASRRSVNSRSYWSASAWRSARATRWRNCRSRSSRAASPVTWSSSATAGWGAG